MNSYVVALFSVALIACAAESAQPATVGKTSSPLRSLSNAEALADFDEMVTSFRGLYGALERKQARYGFDFETMAKDYRARLAQAESEAEYDGLYVEFIARFEDAHVSLSGELDSDDSHTFGLPFLVDPIEDTYVVTQIGASLGDPPSIAVGDELLSIDGVAADELVQQFAKYVGMPNPLSRRVYAAEYLTLRSNFLSSGLEAGAPVTVRLRDAAGGERDVPLIWHELTNPLYAPAAIPVAGTPAAASAVSICSLEKQRKLAAADSNPNDLPFFMTDAVRAKFNMSEIIRPSARALQRFGVELADAAKLDYFAVSYTYCGAKLLLLRMPDYEPSDPLVAINYLRALLDEQSTLVDGLVFDETRNPGGRVAFGAAIVSLLSSHSLNGVVQEMHADRRSIEEYAEYSQALKQLGDAGDAADAQRFAGYARQIDEAYSAARPLSPPIPFPGLDYTAEADGAHWTKPLIVLADERSGSVGDLVPLLIQANKIAPVFGARTMGAGGNVEQVATLTNSQLQLELSRGLATVFDPSGTYPAQRFIEDLGVTPDIAYATTLADLRAGYVGYVEAFSRELAGQIARAAQP